MVRALAGAALLLSWLAGASAFADCPANHPDAKPALPATLRALADAPRARDERARWAETMDRLAQLERATRDEATRGALPALRGLADVLAAILDDYDGTAQTAHLLRFAAVQPGTCPPPPGGELPRCAWQILDGEVEVPWTDQPPFDCANKTSLLAHVSVAQTLIARLADAHVLHAARDLKEAASAWRRYVESGFSQYPHEVLLNGLWLDPASWGPAPTQLILLHPSVGLGTTNMRRQGGERRAGALVLVVEAAGYVRYLSDFQHHLGVSLAGMLPNFVGSQIGIGPMLHFDGVGVGYGFGLKHDKPQTLLVTFDVTRGIDDGMLGKLPKRWLQGRLR